MDLFQIILFVALIIGILLITISMFLFNRENNSTAVDIFERSNTVKAIDASITELDKTMEEFESLSKSAFEELDTKYHEILFLYNLMSEKKQEIANSLYAEDTEAEQVTMVKAAIPLEKQKKPIKKATAKQVKQPMQIEPEEALEYAEPEEPEEPEEVIEMPDIVREDRQYTTPKSKQIIELLDKGYDVAEIAKLLYMGISEVRLIVELIKANS